MGKDVRKLKDKAATLLTKGKLKKALKVYREIIGKVPDDLHARQRLADVLAKLGDTDGAIREYQHVAGRYASDCLFLKAVAISKVIIALDPTRTETQEALAILYARDLEAEKATGMRFLPASMTAAISKSTEPEPAEACQESVLWEASPTIERAEALPPPVSDEEEGGNRGRGRSLGFCFKLLQEIADSSTGVSVPRVPSCFVLRRHGHYSLYSKTALTKMNNGLFWPGAIRPHDYTLHRGRPSAKDGLCRWSASGGENDSRPLCARKTLPGRKVLQLGFRRAQAGCARQEMARR